MITYIVETFDQVVIYVCVTVGTLTCRPLRSKIVSLFAEHNDLQYAVPGGLIGKFIGKKSS